MYVHLDRTFPYFSAPGLKIYGIMKENARNRKASKSGAKAIKLNTYYILSNAFFFYLETSIFQCSFVQ